ncbi:hypothetical protein QLQ85_17620 [Halomonas sp. M4R5S39]|uniref:hypothetical protein n=1 Tax=Halomonas kalidii TaxID=3043293 RepID=UPI0024A837BF|nr:hypothetical protein [Halomonas kalidii]MDI5986617.1 hypothetical protein [Halomonas kalidii]
MARIPAILRLSPKLALAGNTAFFAKAVARAAAKPPPPPPNPPQYSSPQVTTPVQWNGGNTTFHPVQATNSTPFPGYGVYSSEYLEAMSLDLSVNQDDPYLIPDSYAPAGSEDPLQDVPTVDPVDNIETEEATAEDIVDDVAEGKSIAQVAEEYRISPQDVLDRLEAGGLEVEATQSDDGSESTIEIVDGETDETVVEYRFTEQPDGVVVEESTNADGETTTTVIDEQGNRTELDPEQETTREGVEEIVEGVADGQSIDEIAREQGLDPDQVVAQLEAAGFEVESGPEGQGPNYSNTTRITDEESGELVVSHEADPGGTSTSVVTDPNGVTVEEVTDADGETTTTVIDEDGNRTELDPSQDTTRESVDEIARRFSEGKELEAIANELGVTEEQLIAQLLAAGFKVTDSEAKDGRYRAIYSHGDDGGGGEIIASYDDRKSTVSNYGPRGRENGGNGHHSYFVNSQGREVERYSTRPEGPLVDGGLDITIIVDEEGVTTRTTIDNGETTREVSRNDRTVIADDDGNVTLRDDESGDEIAIEDGEVSGDVNDDIDEAMIEAIQAADLDGEDGEIFQIFIDAWLNRDSWLFGGDEDEKSRADELEEEYRAREREWEEIIAEGDDSKEAQEAAREAVLASDLAYIIWQEAIYASLVRRATLEFYAVDPDSEEAMRSSMARINEILNSHGWGWSQPVSQLSPDEARERLEELEAVLELARKAKTELQESERLLGEANSEQEDISQRLSPGEFDGDNSVAHTRVNETFSSADVHGARGARFLAEFKVADLELIKGDVERNPDAYEGVDIDDINRYLKEARSRSDDAEENLGRVEAQYDVDVAKREAAEVREHIIDEYIEEYVDEDGTFYRYDGVLGQHSGEYKGYSFNNSWSAADGSIWIDIHYENTTKTVNVAPPRAEMDAWWEENRNGELIGQWHDARSRLVEAKWAAGEVGEEHSEARIEELRKDIRGLEEQEGEFGPLSIEAPDGALPEHELVEIDGRVQVPGPVAERYEQVGIEALREFDLPVRVMADGEGDLLGRPQWQWVESSGDAYTYLEQQDLEEQLAVAESTAQWYAEEASQPARQLGESEEEYRQRARYDALGEEYQQRTLDNVYQPRFREFLDGPIFNAEFARLGESELGGWTRQALGVSGGRVENLDQVLEQIRDHGGDNPEVRAVPLSYVGLDGSMATITLVAVKDGDGDTRYVDATGRDFRDLEDFRKHNRQLNGNGRLVAPADLEMTPGRDGSIPLKVVDVRGPDTTLDYAVNYTTMAATGASFIPGAAPIAVPLAIVGGIYIGARSAYNQWHHIGHGGDWYDTESLMNYASIASAALPMVASSLRFTGMVGQGVNMTAAARTSIGAVNPLSYNPVYQHAVESLKQGGRWARRWDVASLAVDVPQTFYSAAYLHRNHHQMAGREFTEAMTNLAIGVYGSGMSIRGLQLSNPGEEGTTEGQADDGYYASRRDGQNGAPDPLSAAYHPEGTPYPERPSQLPEGVRRSSPQRELPDIASDSPLSLTGTAHPTISEVFPSRSPQEISAQLSEIPQQRFDTYEDALESVIVNQNDLDNYAYADISIEAIRDGHFRVDGKELTPHEFILSGYIEEGDIGPDVPVVLDVRDTRSMDMSLSQRLSDVLSKPVVVPSFDATSKWQVFLPKHGLAEHRAGSVSLSDSGDWILTQGVERSVIEPDVNDFGQVLGMGATSVAFRWFDKVIVVKYADESQLPGSISYEEGADIFNDIDKQEKVTKELIEKGAPYVAPVHEKIDIFYAVNVNGVSREFSHDARVMDFYATHDRTIVSRSYGSNNRTVGSLTDVSLLNENSLRSLRAMRDFYSRSGIEVDDPQFLIHADGSVWLHDFSVIRPISTPSSLIKLIDHHIGLAESVVRQRASRQSSLAPEIAGGDVLGGRMGESPVAPRDPTPGANDNVPTPEPSTPQAERVAEDVSVEAGRAITDESETTSTAQQFAERRATEDRVVREFTEQVRRQQERTPPQSLSAAAPGDNTPSGAMPPVPWRFPPLEQGGMPEPGTFTIRPHSEGQAAKPRTHLYRLGDLDALRQAIVDGQVPVGHNIHFVRLQGSAEGIALGGGKVPYSGVVQDDGKIRWPAGRTGQADDISVTTLNAEGRQVVEIRNEGKDGKRIHHVQSNQDVYAVVTTLTAADIRKAQGGLPFDEYRPVTSLRGADGLTLNDSTRNPSASNDKPTPQDGDSVTPLHTWQQTQPRQPMETSNSPKVDGTTPDTAPRALPESQPTSMSQKSEASAATENTTPGIDQLPSLSEPQLKSISPSELAQADPKLFGQLPSDKLAAFTDAQWNALRKPQLDQIDTSLLQQYATQKALKEADRKGTITKLSVGSQGPIFQLHGVERRGFDELRRQSSWDLLFLRMKRTARITESSDGTESTAKFSIDSGRLRDLGFLDPKAEALLPEQSEIIEIQVHRESPPAPDVSRNSKAMMKTALTIAIASAGGSALMLPESISIVPEVISQGANYSASFLRGASFFGRSLAPIRTAADTTLGRNLRILEVATTVMNLIPTAEKALGGESGWVTWPTTIAYLLYMGNAGFEAITGKGVIAAWEAKHKKQYDMLKVDDLGLPLYAVSSGLATQSVFNDSQGIREIMATLTDFNNLLGVVGGGMFTLGSLLLLRDAHMAKLVKEKIKNRLTHGIREMDARVLDEVLNWDQLPLWKRLKFPSTADRDFALFFGVPMMTAYSSLPVLERLISDSADQSNSGSDETEDEESESGSIQSPLPSVEPSPSPRPTPEPAEASPSSTPESTLSPSPLPDQLESSWEGLYPQVSALSSGSFEHYSSSENVEAGGRRTNPALEDQGHDWVEAESHLSLGGIAIRRGRDIAEVVELNLGHISDPGTLHPGDRVYLPKSELA